MELVISKTGQGRSTYLLNVGIRLTKLGKEVRIYCDDSLAGELFKRLQQDGTADMNKIEIHETADLKAIIKSAVEVGINPNTVIIVDGNQTDAKLLVDYAPEKVINLSLIVGAQVSPMTVPEGIATYSNNEGYKVIKNNFDVKGAKGTLYASETAGGARPLDMAKAIDNEMANKRKEANEKIQGGSAISTDFFKKD